MILYKQEGGDFLFHEFNIEASDERRYPAQYFYYIHPHSFVKTDATLQSQYQSVTKYLGIDELHPGYTINPSFVIGSSPYFEDGELICPSLQETLDEVAQKDFIEFLFGQWSKNETARNIISQTVWSEINDTPIEQVLGFVPNLVVLQDAENIPAYLQTWLNADEAIQETKTEFLKDLGVNTGDSPAVRLRNFLAHGGTWDLEESPMSNFENDFYFNANTLNHLEGHGITLLQIFTILQKQGKPLMPMEVYPKKWGKKSAERIHLSNPKLDGEKLLTRAKEWEVEHYQKWRSATEVDHRVFFYGDTLPYSLFFQEEALYTEEREEGSITDDQHRLFVSQKNNQAIDELVKTFLPSSEYVRFLEAKAQSPSTSAAPVNVQATVEEPDVNIPAKGISDKLAQFIIDKGLTDEDISALEEFLAKRNK